MGVNAMLDNILHICKESSRRHLNKPFDMQDAQITLLAALGQFTQWGMGKYASRTVSTYTDQIGRFIKWRGNGPLNKVDPMEVAKWSAILRARGYGQSSTAYAMIALRQFFKFLFLRRLILWDYQLISVPKYVSRHYAPVQINEVQTILASMPTDSFKAVRDKAIISLLFSSGVRVSELCGLMAAEIDLEKGFTTIVSKKNRQVRMVFWDAATASILSLYATKRREWLYGTRSGFLFVSCDRRAPGEGITTRSVERIVEEWRTRPNITPHSFRHGLGMRAVSSGIHARHIQKILGHKNITSSQIYMDTNDGEVAAAYKKIEIQTR